MTQAFRGIVRLLFLADTHLGLDAPLRPRVQRRRRGDDFLANYLKALEPALQQEVDLLLHGGDMFFRSGHSFAVHASGCGGGAGGRAEFYFSQW